MNRIGLASLHKNLRRKANIDHVEFFPCFGIHFKFELHGVAPGSFFVNFFLSPWTILRTFRNLAKRLERNFD